MYKQAFNWHTLSPRYNLFVMMVHSLCLGTGARTSLPPLFPSFKNFFVFSVDLISRNINLDIKDLPQVITLHKTILHLQSATLWSGNHYICVFNYKNTWLIYDGLQESREKKMDSPYLTLIPGDFQRVMFCTQCGSRRKTS